MDYSLISLMFVMIFAEILLSFGFFLYLCQNKKF